MKRLYLLLPTLLLFGFNTARLMAQCAMCQAVAKSSTQESANAAAFGLNTGILYLFLMPYTLVMVIGIMWYRRYKRSKAAA